MDPRCAWCHGALEDEDLLTTCPGCRTVLHSACARETGDCPTLGCAHVFLRAKAPRRSKITGRARRGSRWQRPVLAAAVICVILLA